MFQAEPFQLHSIVTGTVWLDGGAMFGVIPKILWERVSEVDERNRIRLTTRTLLAIDRTASRVVLVDTGCGTKWHAKQAARYRVSYDPQAIPGALAAAGLSVDDVTDVVVTHLHFDHNGGLTEWLDDPGGRAVLRYPKANHWVHEAHWLHARRPHPKDQASFLQQDFAALEEADVLRLVEGDQPDGPFEGVTWLVSNGHTPGQLHPIFGAGAHRLLFVADTVPTVAHLRLGWVMAYDMAPVTTIAEKQAIYRRCFEEGLTLAFPHDPEVGGAAIEGTVERPIVAKTLPL